MQKKFVAFLDILGFKDLVENNSAEALTAIYSEALAFAYSRSIEILDNDLRYGDQKINSLIVSDSILFWSENNDVLSFSKMIVILHAFMFAAITEGIPLRGALEYDELVEVSPPNISKNLTNTTPIILGKALVKGYTKESKQNWAGCTVSSECIERVTQQLKGNKEIELLDEFGYIIKYKVPYKNGAMKEEMVINWPKILHFKPDPARVRASFKLHSKNVDDWDVENKIRNTLDFLEFSWLTKTFHVGNLKGIDSKL